MLCVLMRQLHVFFHLSDEGLDFYGNEESSHGVYMLNEALDRVNLYWLFIIFFFLPCFKFQFELSFCSAFHLFWSSCNLHFVFQFIPVWCSSWLSLHLTPLLSQTSKKVAGWITQGIHFSEYEAKAFFYHPPKHPPLYLMSSHTFPFHLRQDARENFPSVDIINLN